MASEAPARVPGTAGVTHVRRVGKPQAEVDDKDNDAWIKQRSAEVAEKRKAQRSGKATGSWSEPARKKAARKK